MFDALLMIYYEEYKETRRKLKVSDYILLVLFVAFIISFWIFAMFGKNISALISLILFIGDIVIIVKRAYKLPQYEREDMLKRKRKRIDALIALLKEDAVKMYDIDSIELLIRQAKEYEKKDEEKIAKKSFGSFFSIVVYPIIAGISGIVVKNISDEQIVTLGITVMFLLIFAFFVYSIIYPEIKKNENKYKIIAIDMRADLELIMNDLKKAEN